MNLATAVKKTQNTIDGKQDPDMVTYKKQWDEFGRLKGWMVYLTWTTTPITLDITPHYTRVIGDLSAIPDYEPGKHKRV